MEWNLLSAILDNIGLLSGNPSFLFGIAADAIFVDCSGMTVRTGKTFVTDWTAGGENIFKRDDTDPYNPAMPFSGKVIGLYWHILTYGGYAGTFTFDILINGVEVLSDALTVTSADGAGTHISEALAIAFNAGDRVTIHRNRTLNTTHEQHGAFAIVVKWD